MIVHSTENKQHNGFFYVAEGWRLVKRPSLRAFVVVPLVMNILLLGGAFWWLYRQLGHWMTDLMAMLPSWLQWLDYLIWPIAVISMLLIFTYFFSTIANMIAAPFNGWLSEKLEAELIGAPPVNLSLRELFQEVPRILVREFVKLWYFISRSILLLLLFLIPAIGQTVAPILWFLFGAWVMAIQYIDYPFDNHRIAFSQMKRQLSQDRQTTLQFGVLVNLLTMIPIVNLVIMPVAVCGATALWVDRFREEADRTALHSLTSHRSKPENRSPSLRS